MTTENNNRAKTILKQIESQAEHAIYMLEKPDTIDLTPKEILKNTISNALNLLNQLNQLN